MHAANNGLKKAREFVAECFEEGIKKVVRNKVRTT
jgi:hypothetical protein